ncbi:MAG: exonuclease subunit SbcD [Cyanobacteriota bacterium]|nr:exonuclease subunit SbcD [Cyanobacteriota bacterium]
MKILHLSDIHMGSGFSHGRTNPETGLNTRLEDFVTTLGRCIDRALSEPVDLVLFGGDAFPDATPPPYVAEAFASQFRRLSEANIPTVLLVGNHDRYSQGQGSASLCIYRTLGVPGFIVGDRLETHRITTQNGPVQIVTLPWLTRSTLLTRPETQGLPISEVNQLLVDRLRVALEGEIRQLDPDVPSVLLGHLMSDNATFGAERFLAVSRGFTIPLSLLIRSQFDYVALGHVHKHQNLNPNNDPPIIYPGSIERVDFSEEKEDKGYVLIDLERGRADWEFCPLPVRSFQTITANVSEAENPQAELLKAIGKKKIRDAVVRLSYKIGAEGLESIEMSALHEALKEAHTYTIHPELVSQLARPRVPELGIGRSIDPIQALTTYIENRDDLQEIQSDLLAAAQSLLSAEEEVWQCPVEVGANLTEEAETSDDRPQNQLRLL